MDIMMKKINVIFCVLTYKNHTDLIEFADQLKNNKKINFSYKVIVINNYADEESLKKIRKIAISNNCDFIENENKGYSHGNNLGIEFAKLNYEFDYLVVCNPDTLIKQFNFDTLSEHKKSIIAPEIICLNGKRQNPMYYRYMPFSEKIVYYGFLYSNKILFYLGIAMNKFDRYLNNLIMGFLKKNKKKIYAGHGSYLIFSQYSINKLHPVFDENIFLFCEEIDLAKKAERNHINFIYIKEIIILHKEDSSMNLSNRNLNKIHRESYLYYYKKWRNSY
jgi:GT2 family glycosyltransferase